jgi:hypothetical protein
VILITSVLPLARKNLYPATDSKLHRFCDRPKTRKARVPVGEVVIKEELGEALWPDVMVVDGSLATAVSKLRKAMGDDDHPVTVTVPRVGYRTRLPERCTEPSTIASAGKSLAMAGSGCFVALYCAVERREITWTVSLLAQSVVSASVIHPQNNPDWHHLNQRPNC